MVLVFAVVLRLRWFPCRGNHRNRKTTANTNKLILSSMSLISPQLKEILVCPTCHGDLEEDEAKSVLRCTNDGMEFPVSDGIPIMMVPEDLPTESANEAATATDTDVDTPDAA